MNQSPVKQLLVPLCIIGISLVGLGSAFGNFNHGLYDAVLKSHVNEGLVDYKALKTDPRLDQYLEELKEADLDALKNRQDKVAFWTNAYNAYTLKLITQYYPIGSIMDIKEPGYKDAWKIPLAAVGGKTYTLDQIENEILRPNWPDPRIHYALVCAAQSCPQLRDEAYTADKLDAQFDEQAVWFMRNRNEFDLKKRTAVLSQVYDWYAVDFGKNQSDILQTLIPHVDESLAKSFKKDAKKWKIRFVEWDWRLNEQK